MKTLNITVKKGAGVSIHQQLVTQFSLQIASGTLAEGVQLPSVRALSSRLGIHYNTCLAVYKELAAQGLVEIRQGSGVTVRRFPANEESSRSAVLPTGELQQMAEWFVQTVRKKGFVWDEVDLALSLAREQESHRNAQSETLVFADIHDDILPIFRAELERLLARPVETVNITRMESQADAAETRRIYLVSRYHYRALLERVGKDSRIILLEVGTAHEEMALVRSLPEGSLVAVISYSQVILDMAESVITSLRGDELLVRTILMTEGPDEILATTRHARWVVADSLCAPSLMSQLGKPISMVKLVPDSDGNRIQEQIQELSS